MSEPFPADPHWQAILRSIPDAIYAGTAEGITIANQAGLEMLGFHSLDELNRGVAELAERIQTRYADTGEVISAEDQGYSLVAAVAVNTDITEAKRHERALEKAVRDRDEVLALVSHPSGLRESHQQRNQVLTGRDEHRHPGDA